MDLTDAQWAKLDSWFRPNGDRRSWPTVAGYARSAERRFVDSAHRRSLARSARSLSALPNLSSTFSAVAALRAPLALAAETGRGLTRSRKARSERSVHRRQLQFGEKGGSAVGPTKRGKGSKIVAIADRHGLPIAVHVASARPNEAVLVEATSSKDFSRSSERLIGDKAYDSDPLDQRLRETLGVQLISPHRWNRSKPSPKTAARCVATAAAGRLSAVAWLQIFAASWCGGNITREIFSP